MLIRHDYRSVVSRVIDAGAQLEDEVHLFPCKMESARIRRALKIQLKQREMG